MDRPEDLVVDSMAVAGASPAFSGEADRSADGSRTHGPSVEYQEPLRLEQFAFADALSLSVKLALLENSFDTVAVKMESWIENMRRGSLRLPQSSVLKQTGELFTLRHLVNISTSMIETPDFYWDRPKFETLYSQLKSALSVGARSRILNSRLNISCELMDIISHHLYAKHASRLEWMIIILITIEISFEAFYYYERQLDKVYEAKSVDNNHPADADSYS